MSDLARPARRDALLAAVLAVASATEAATYGGAGTGTLAAIVCLPLAWRRAFPLGVPLAMSLLLLAGLALDGELDHGSIIFLAIAVAIFTLGAYGERRRIAPGAAAIFAIALFTALAVGHDDSAAGAAEFIGIILVVFPVLCGLALRRRTALSARLAARARELEAEHALAGERAAVAERTRVATELHALVADGVRRMLDDVAVARDLLDDEPARAVPAIAAIEERGREALSEMRRLLGVLRVGDEDLALAPQPSLARLDALVARYGAGVALRSEGVPAAVTPGLDVAGFRVVEEALAALDDAPAADVLVQWTPRAVALEIAAAGCGLGDAGLVAAIRERVELFGGTLRTQPGRDGRPRLRAEMPLTEVAA